MVRLRSAARQSTSVARESTSGDQSYHSDEQEKPETKPRTRAETARAKLSASKRDTTSSMKYGRTQIAFAQALLAILSQCLITYLVFTDTIKLYPSTIGVEDFKGYASRAEFTLRYISLLVFWLLFSIVSVMAARYKYNAFNPLTKTTEQHMNSAKNVLSNSFEQLFISAFSQLIFASYADAYLILRVIPLVNLLQFTGRIFFWWGYPDNRAFGFNLTILPNVALCYYNLHRFASFTNIY